MPDQKKVGTQQSHLPGKASSILAPDEPVLGHKVVHVSSLEVKPGEGSDQEEVKPLKGNRGHLGCEA